MKHLLSVLFSLLALCHAQAQESYSGTLVADEGAWCWFADPRALHYENQAGTINATYIGYIDVHGNVKATQYDWLTKRKTDVLVRSYFQPDDHNNPTFIVLPDERVMIFYTRHTDEAKIWYRISQKPGDITALGEEKYLATANNTTYPSPFILSDDPNHIYLCWRGINWHPTIARLTMPDAQDNCRFDFGPKQIVQSTGARPYAKYQSNGKDKIYLAYTTGHPDNEQPDWLYFNVIDINHGNGPILRDIKGNLLSVVANGVHNVNKQSDYASAHPAAVVDNTANIRNWVWQITLDQDERPVIAYPHIDNAKTTHVYWYARWTGSEWRRTWVQYAGHAFHQNWNRTELCYSGGMAVDPEHINDMYLSIPTKNGQYDKDGVYEIWKYTIDDEGKVAGSEQLTHNSAKNNVRPFIIPGSKNSPMRLAWMNGDYYYWMVNRNYPQGYPTSIRCDYAWEEKLTPEDENEPRTDCWCLGVNKTLCLAFEMNPNQYAGSKLFDLGNMTYAIDANNYPTISIGNQTFRSQNRLLTSDSWAYLSNGTSGDNHPTPLTTWVLALTYDGHTLTTYRNGLVDQVISTEDLQGGTAEAHGDGYPHTLLYQTDYYACASPITVQHLMADLQDKMEEERKAKLPTALQNGNFEGTYSVQASSGVSSDRAIYVPEGWTVQRTNADHNDITALKSGDLYFDRFFGALDKPEANGQQTYWIRQNWGTPTLTLSQELRLPAGKYTLSAQLWKSGLGGDAFVRVSTEGGQTSQSPSLENKAAWQTISMELQSDGQATTTISLVAMHNSDGSEKIIGWDNIELTRDPETGIDAAKPTAHHAANALTFDLNGRRAPHPSAPGIYVSQGRKVAMK